MCVCVKPEIMYGHVCCKLRNSLGGYGGIRVVSVADDLGGSRGQGGVVAESAVGRGVFYPSTLLVSLLLQILAA